MSNSEVIQAARERFDRELTTESYSKMHSDEIQLASLIELTDPTSGRRYLDLGTGNGYVAFAMAQKNSSAFVEGLDIATDTIEANNEKSRKSNLGNVHFTAYDGYDFPFADSIFHGSISRFAFHHFPNINNSISEISRVLDDAGFFILSDPKTYDEDTDNFIDQFQSQKKDGHIHFYRYDEIVNYFKRHSYFVEKEFTSFFRFSRRMDGNYEEILKQAGENILNKYEIEIVHDQVFVTVSVMNIKFRKRAN